MLEYDRVYVYEAIDIKKTTLFLANVLFVITGIFLRQILDFSENYVLVVMI